MGRRGDASLLSIFWNVCIILVLVLLAIDVVSLAYSSVAVITPELVKGSLQEQPIFTIFPVLAAVFYLTGSTTITVYFIVILIALFFTLVYLTVRDGREVARLIRSPVSSLLPRLRSKNRWTMVAQLFLAVSFFQVAYISLLQAAGIQTNPPPSLESDPLWYTMFALANASVYEEFASRLVLIGLPMFIGSFVLRLRSLGHRPLGEPADPRKDRRFLMGSLRYLIGGNVDRRSPRPVLTASLVLVIFSAVFFGIAHQGWGAWKLFPAAVAGLALGYAFLRGGFIAAILLHFSIDYSSATVLLVQNDESLLVFLAFLLLALWLIGAGFFLYYVIYSRNLFREAFQGHKPGVPLPAQAGGGPGGGLTVSPAQPGLQYRESQTFQGRLSAPVFATVCPFCSWPESRYIDGKLTCSNCGRTR